MAVLCLGCCTLQNKEFAQKHLPLLLQVLQIDNIKIKLSALKAIFDQLMLFGIEPFKTRKGSDSQSESAHIGTENDEEESETIEEEEETATIHSLLKLLSGFLDSEVRNIIKFALVLFYNYFCRWLIIPIGCLGILRDVN